MPTEIVCDGLPLHFAACEPKQVWDVKPMSSASIITEDRVILDCQMRMGCCQEHAQNCLASTNARKGVFGRWGCGVAPESGTQKLQENQRASAVRGFRVFGSLERL